MKTMIQALLGFTLVILMAVAPGQTNAEAPPECTYSCQLLYCQGTTPMCRVFEDDDGEECGGVRWYEESCLDIFYGDLIGGGGCGYFFDCGM